MTETKERGEDRVTTHETEPEIQPYSTSDADIKRVFDENQWGLLFIKAVIRSLQTNSPLRPEHVAIVEKYFPNWTITEFEKVLTLFEISRKERDRRMKLNEVCKILGLPSESPQEIIIETIKNL